MKKVSLLVALMVSMSVALTAQNNYQFQMFTDEYSEFSNGTSLTDGESWDDLEVPVQIGFPFQVYGTPLDVVTAPGMGSEIYMESDEGGVEITPFLFDFVDPCYDEDEWKKSESDRSSCSDISYLLEGDPGHRIFKMQWANAGFWDVDYETVYTNYYINMQVWLYEEDNAVEFRYGPSVVSDQLLQQWIAEEEAYFYSMILGSNFNGEFVSIVNGDPTNPNFVSGLIDTMSEETFIEFGLTSFPAANTVYRLVPQEASGVHSYENIDFTIAPNPVDNLLNIYGADNAFVQIFDVNGKQILSEVYNKPIPVSELPSGLYMVKITTDQGSVVKKIVK